MKLSVFWFRRDLRLEDNTSLNRALGSGHPVLPIFIFDDNILEELPGDDPRVNFIHDSLKTIDQRLRDAGSSLLVLRGDPLKIWEDLVAGHDIAAVYINRDYEPYAAERDRSVEKLLRSREIPLHSFKDQVVFECGEVVKQNGGPYTVYTPYRKRWMERFRDEPPQQAPPLETKNFFRSAFRFPELDHLGFRTSTMKVRPCELSRLDLYASLRDYPSEDITTHLSPHLRFGTVSIREIIARLGASHEVFLGELIWREFFMQILHHFPEVVTRNFNPRYNALEWRNNEAEFERWCNGETGFPLVDAGMRQLNMTGFMHNRVRMVTAGFLCKHLLVDWRWGEAYFAQKLLDYELSSNNGNWQWAAGTGCDAAPYFRVFNPVQQAQKFDSAGNYVRQWVPEYGTSRYPEPMVDHRQARQRTLDAYKKALSSKVREG